MTTPLSKPLHLSIAVSQDEPGFTRELRLIKVGLLYADQSTIFNLHHAIFAPMILTKQRIAGKHEAASIFLESLANEPFAKGTSPNLLLQQLEEIDRAQKSGLLQEGFVEPAAAYFSWLPQYDAYVTQLREEIMRAVIRDWPNTTAERSYQSRLPKPPEAFFYASDYLFRSLADGNTYPLLDQKYVQEWANYVARIQADNTNEVALPDGAETKLKAREVSLAADLFSRLPTFESATIDEILDIRRELDRPLAGFRSEVIRLAEQISAEPWDKDFEQEAERLVRRDIEPAILHLEDEVKSNTLLSKLAQRSLKDPLEVGSKTGIGLILGSFSGAATALVGGALGGGLVAVEAYKEWKEKQKEIERNQVYFYYAAGERLKRSKGKRGKAK